MLARPFVTGFALLAAITVQDPSLEKALLK